jgi:Serine/threonine protein kinase
MVESLWRKPTASITLAARGNVYGEKALVESQPAQEETEKTRLATSKDELLVRFKPYAAVSRWFEHRMAQTNMWTSLAIVTASFMAFAVVASWLGEFIKPLIYTLLNGDTGKAISAIITGGTAAGGPLVMLGLIFAVLLGVGVTGLTAFLIRLYLKPTHIRFDSSGITWTRYDKLRKCYINIKSYDWKNLSHVRLERKGGNALNTEPRLVFIWNGHEETQLELSSIPTLEEKATILTALDRWNKDVPVESEVITSLAISPEHSYTEVWMQALCAPPKRERLKPLVDGTALREGQYTVQKQLGAGGQGVAYLATDSITGKDVVLKEMLLPVFVDMTVRKQALDRFEGECRILRSLDHEQIVKLSNFFVEDHRAYLVLEYIDGRNLKQEINSGRRFSSEEIKTLALDMCNILEYLHSRTPSVVHRDFTPDNLMLTSDGRLKLIDFNVANQQEETATGTVVGKQSYMPLEQFQGDPSPVSDIYALGATLFYLSTGKEPEPLSTSHPLNETSKLKDNEPILENFDTLVAKCTEVNHKRRYQSVQELKQALEEL